MDFRILGPLEVRDRGRLIELNRAKHRALLTLLLLKPGDVLSTDELIDGLWGECPPRTAKGALQNYVAQLRQALGSGLLLTRSGGYMLDIRPDQVDLGRFERLVDEAGVVDGVARVEKLRQGLALWRGPPLIDVLSEPFAALEAARLEQHRAVAAEDLIDARLSLGAGTELVAELGALIAEHPFRERPRGQLMLALYRAGRPAEALEVYRETRQFLVAELGIEPGRELRQLERAILQGDPTLDALPTTRSNIPVQPTPLIGRERELREVLDLLSENRLVTLTGAGGIGKTRLAAQAAAKSVGDFADGAWFVSLAAVRDPALVLPTVANVLEIDEPQRLEEQLRERQLLLLLDNFEQVLGAAVSLVPLLQRAPRLKLLVTSRSPLHLLAEQEYPVPPLGDDDAALLFARRARAVKPSFLPDRRVGEICRRLDNLPLALELAASRAKTMSSEELLAGLGRSLPLLTGGPRDLPARQQTLQATIAWSYDLLAPTERELFGWLTVFSGGFSLEAARSVAATKLDALQSLVDKSLLRQEREERFSMLETVREFGLDLLEREELDKVRERHARFFADLVRRPPGTLQALATPAGRRLRERVAPDVENVRAAVEWALTADQVELALDIAHESDAIPVTPLEVASWYDRALEREDSIPSVTAARGYRDAAGTRFLSLGQLSDAQRLCERSLVLYRNLGDLRGQAYALSTLGSILEVAGRPNEARDCLKRALAMAEEHSFDEMIAPALNNLGVLERDAGEVERAAELLTECITRARATKNLGVVGASLHSLGDLLLGEGDVGAAEARYGEALAVGRDLMDMRLSMYCLGGLASTAARRGDVAGAGTRWGAALAIEGTFGWTFFGSARLRYEQALAGVAGPEFEAAVAQGDAAAVEAAIDSSLAALARSARLEIGADPALAEREPAVSRRLGSHR